MRALGRLLRLSLAPSAAADVAAGALLAHGSWPLGRAPWVLMLGSLCVYHGGLALNDWADREEDRRLRPERPIPSGAVAPGAALALALGLLVLGAGLGWASGRGSGALLTLVALTAVGYDLAGRGPWLGPLCLALCRAGNLGAGLVLGHSLASGAAGDVSGLPGVWLAAPAACYGLYVLAVSRLGRLEDLDDGSALGTRPRAPLLAAAFCLLTPAFFARAPLRALAALGLAAAGALALLREAGAGSTRAWTRARVLAAMGLALRRLLVFDAALALCAPWPDGWIVAAAILCGYPLAHALRGVFPPS